VRPEATLAPLLLLLYLPLQAPSPAPPLHPRDALAAERRVAYAAIYRVSSDTSDARFSAIARRARALRDRAIEAEARIDLAETRNVGWGGSAALAAVDSALRLVPVHEHRLAARAHCLRAHFLMRLGRAGVARELALGHRLARSAGAERERALCFLLEGAWQLNVGTDGSARPLLDSAEVITRRIDDGVRHASVRFWLGYDLFTHTHYAEAKPQLEAAAREGRANGNLRAAAWGHRYLHSIAAQHGDRESAARELHDADSLFRAVMDREGLAQVTAVRGTAFAARGDWSGAEGSARELIRAGRELGLASLEQRGRSMLMRAAIWTGRVQAARIASDSLRALLATRDLQTFAGDVEYGDGLVALVAGELPVAARHFSAYLAGSNPGQRLQRYMARARLAEVDARAGRLDSAERQLDEALVELETLRSGLADLRPLAFQAQAGWDDPDVGFATTLALLVDGGRAAAAFGLAERRRARELADQLTGHVPTTAPGIVHTLPPRTALLEFVTGRPRQPTVLFAVSSAGVRGYLLPSIDSLASDVRRLDALLEAGDEGSGIARRLGGALLEQPLAELPADVTRLMIVPDDELHRLPFDVLLLADGRAVLDRYATAVVPSAAVAVGLRARAPVASDRVLAMADPLFMDEKSATGTAAVLRSAFERNGGLARLPASAREAGIVASLSRAAEVRLRDEASEVFLKRQAGGAFRIVHFATHALVDERSTSSSALALAPGGGEDGFVGPQDLARLGLRADLVVLSACRTAGGVVLRGEGIQGLTAPLLAGGARSVVATQWRIADRATLRLVERFYDELSAGAPVDEALRRAKRAVRDRGVPARDWAAFVLVGDGTGIIPLDRPALLSRVRRWWAMR